MNRLRYAALAASLFLHSSLTYGQDSFTNGLVAYYPFNGNAEDKSGNGNAGAVIGYDWHYSTDRFGESNSLYLNTTSSPSATFDGTYVVVPRAASFDFNQDFTVSVWVNLPNGLGAYYVHNLISNGPDTNSANLRIISDSDGAKDYLQFVFNHQDGDVHAYVEPLRNTWWQAVVVRSGSNVTLFRNGSPITNSVVSSSVMNSPSIWLGRQLCPGYPTTCPGSYPLIGGIDQVRLYNRAFSTLEILQLYQHEANPLPYLTIAVKTIRLSLFVDFGTTNQLDSSTNLSFWTPYGSPFVATNSVVYADVDVFGTQQRFFRMRRLIQ
jgi:hypothetical protein